MRYRKYGRDGPDLSVLGFGVMRLPGRRKGDLAGVNFTRSVAIMRRAMEAGVNFFDSHHFYHNGLSEVAIGRALKGWKGRQMYVQTKSPFYQRKPQKYFKGLIEEALTKMQVNCIDYLLFHSMTKDSFDKRGRQFIRLTDWAIKRGYIRFRGFSSHDKPRNVKAIINTREFSAMLVNYNWLNPEMADVLAHGAERGLGVSVMGPIGGGGLAQVTPQIMRLLPGAKSPAETALRYVLSTPGVCTALSGMNAIEQVDQNVRVASRRTYMTSLQRREMTRRMAAIRRKGKLLCTYCGYCMPCPHGVDIPANLRLLSQVKLFGLTQLPKAVFDWLRQGTKTDKSALACTRCKACLVKCPNGVDVIGRLAETADLLAGPT